MLNREQNIVNMQSTNTITTNVLTLWPASLFIVIASGQRSRFDTEQKNGLQSADILQK